MTKLFSTLIYLQKKRELAHVELGVKRKHSRVKFIAKAYRAGKVEDFHETARFLKFSDDTCLGEFTITIDIARKVISFGPAQCLGMIPSEYRGCGLGSYCMGKLIEFASSYDGGFRVQAGKLSWVDAQTPLDRAIRNGFYERMGFTLIFSDDGKKGEFRCESLGKLNTTRPRNKIREVAPWFQAEAFEKYSNQLYDLDAKSTTLECRDKRIGSLERKNSRLLTVIAVTYAALFISFYVYIS